MLLLLKMVQDAVESSFFAFFLPTNFFNTNFLFHSAIEEFAPLDTKMPSKSKLAPV